MKHEEEWGKVLIVDDMLLHLDTVKLYLEMSDIGVLTASDIDNAWALVTQEKPDLILLDVIMPGGSGLELLRRIKSHYPSIAVIIMTAYGSEDVVAQALKLGAVDYVRKPIKYSYLVDVVEKALDRQQDIKIHEQAVKKLKSQYEELQVSADSILECMSAGVVAVDNNLCIRTINEKARVMMGEKGKKVIGISVYKVFPFLKENNLLKKTLQKQRGYRRYEVIISGEQGKRILSVNTDLILNFHRQIIGVVAVFEDITELRQKEELLRERERLALVGQMAAGMAHEIKNPLTAIKGLTQLLSAKSSDPGLKQHIMVIISEINRMSNVIQDFLLLAKPKEPELVSISITDVLGEIMPLITSQAIINNVHVEMLSKEYLPPTPIDPNQMKQVVLNMVQNAIEAMIDGGTLTIITKHLPEQQSISLQISDTGCGIPADKIKDLGVPFYTTKDNGTGLGLGICLSIVDQHKGRVEIDSIEGRGTTFSVLLPTGA